MGSTAYITKVLVTGANTGLGWQISKKLATEHKDYHIIMSGRNKEAVEKAAADFQSQGLTNVESLVLDISSDESIADAVKAVDQKHGRLDVLINNAGITSDNGAPAETDLSREKWDMVFQVNVFGTALVTDAFLPLLEKSQAPTKRIVFMSSSLSSVGQRFDKATPWRKAQYRIYSTSKTALNMVMAHYAVEKEDDPSWKINACCPGHCATNLNGGMGADDPALGAINACRLATLGVEGESGTFTNRHGPLPW
ncbi:short chain dehydrogenase [Coniochaeta ligniaria NRRL 30616]|uniref:Short chain dehydrogenase n=1 Tax=Coniochaeta ligniaria NRRL 30616 TaxID=1408157 RepID=A0A1J7JLW6_9PEZI|nr:short chain dehydrogenase [Coniochaeta ligniaria NRRL 30616]